MQCTLGVSFWAVFSSPLDLSPELSLTIGSPVVSWAHHSMGGWLYPAILAFWWKDREWGPQMQVTGEGLRVFSVSL